MGNRRVPAHADAGGTTKDDGGGNFGLGIAEYFSGPPQVAVTVDQYNANDPAVKEQYPLASFGNDPQLAQNRIGADHSNAMLAASSLS